jgi:hypothetical protein
VSASAAAPNQVKCLLQKLLSLIRSADAPPS